MLLSVMASSRAREKPLLPLKIKTLALLLPSREVLALEGGGGELTIEEKEERRGGIEGGG